VLFGQIGYRERYGVRDTLGKIGFEVGQGWVGWNIRVGTNKLLHGGL